MKQNWILYCLSATFMLALTAMKPASAPLEAEQLYFGSAGFVHENPITAPYCDTQNLDTLSIKVEIQSGNDLRIQVHCENYTGKKLRLLLLQKDNTVFGYRSEMVMHEDIVEGSLTQFDRVLNLSQLENGTYEIEITSGKERFVRRIQIQNIAEKATQPRKITF